MSGFRFSNSASAHRRITRGLILALGVLVCLSWPGRAQAQQASAVKGCPSAGTKNLVCIRTQKDSTTPLTLPAPLDVRNGKVVTVDIGPLSPVESCSLTSIKNSPATLTNEASVASLISILLGTKIPAIVQVAGRSLASVEKRKPGSAIGELGEKVDSAKRQMNEWIGRRSAALNYLSMHQYLLSVGGRQDAKAGQDISTLAKCLDEESHACAGHPKFSFQDKLNLEQRLALLAVLVKSTPASGPGDKEKLLELGGQLAKLKTADADLRAGESALRTVFAKAKVAEEHTKIALGTGPGPGLHEKLHLQPSHNSNVTTSVTCTSVVDNSTTLGPVPLTIHSGGQSLVYSVGALYSLTRHQTLGLVPTPCTTSCAGSTGGSGASGYQNSIEKTGADEREVIPFAFLTWIPRIPVRLHIPRHRFGITGGIGFNPYPGVTGVNVFFGLSCRWKKIYFHAGIHGGQFQYVDTKSGLTIGEPVPSGISSVPTRNYLTWHPAFGASYSF